MNSFLPSPVDDDELKRIMAASQRPIPDGAQIEALIEKWTRALMLQGHDARGNCGCPIFRLNGVQAWALDEASCGYGTVGALKVGSGKTGLNCLLPMVFPRPDGGPVRRAMLLLQPRLIPQFKSDLAVWGRHFRVPNLCGGDQKVWPLDRPVLEVMSYSKLSAQSETTFFSAHPDIDLYIWDECHTIRRRPGAGSGGMSARSGRAIQPFLQSENVRLCAHSGSLTTRGIHDYAATCALALRDRSPLPWDPNVVDVWAGVLDPEPKAGFRAAPGALTKLCLPGETAEAAFYRRRNATPGFITTPEARLPVKVTIRARDPGPIPPRVKEALAWARKAVRADWLVTAGLNEGEGEELVDQATVARTAREAAVGLVLRWKFPRGEPEQLILDWRQARKNYHREVREQLEHFRAEHLDSPGLWYSAAKRFWSGYDATKHANPLPTWRSEYWPKWNELEEQVVPEPEAVWIDQYLVEDAARWAREAPGIVFTDHPAFGRTLGKMSKLPYFGGGPVSDELILKETGSRSIICARKSYGTGQNLQRWHRMLLVDLPSDAGALEQAIGREFRPGQTKDVDVSVYYHTSEFRSAWKSICRFSHYASNTNEFVVEFADLVGLDRDGEDE